MLASPRVGLLAALVLAGCPADSADPRATAEPPTPTVSVQPPEASQATPYAPWQAAPNPDQEPADVLALLREYDPQMTDSPPRDQKGDKATDDLDWALAVADSTHLYARVFTREPMRPDAGREIRFWIDQGKPLATVEVKVGSVGRPCEVSSTANPEAQQVINDCFWHGTALDLRFPLSALPPELNTTQPFWVSGFEACCEDDARSVPLDKIEAAQEVWRVGVAGAPQAPMPSSAEGGAPPAAAPTPVDPGSAQAPVPAPAAPTTP